MEELDLHEGDRVRHRVFGEGTIVEINVEEEAVMVQFDRCIPPGQLPCGPQRKLIPMS
jgi:hypothetical protein